MHDDGYEIRRILPRGLEALGDRDRVMDKRIVLLGHVRRCFPVGRQARVKLRLVPKGWRTSHIRSASIRRKTRSARKVALFYTKSGNQSRRKQPRYVSGDLALLQTGTRYLAFPSLGVNVQPVVGQTGWTSELELPFLRILVFDIDRVRSSEYIFLILCKWMEIFPDHLSRLWLSVEEPSYGIINYRLNIVLWKI